MLDATSPNLISSRCRRRGSRALCLGGQLRCRERRAVEDVALARLEPVQAVARQHLADDDGAGDDHRRALRFEARHAAPLLERQRCQPLELLLDGRAREHVAVHAVGVVLDEPEVERRERRDRAGDADRAPRLEVGELRADVRRAGLDVVAEALGQRGRSRGRGSCGRRRRRGRRARARSSRRRRRRSACPARSRGPR